MSVRPNGADLSRILPALIGLAGCVLAGYFALHAPISRDSAFGLQWAHSIGTSFKFQMTEVPRLIYPPTLSNGGPLMYAGGLGYALTHSVDGSIAVATVSGFAMLEVGLILLDPWLGCVAVAALFVWPIFGYLSTAFLAEFWATGLTLTGLAVFARAQSAPTIAKLFADRRTWFALFLFSLGTWSKVVACFAILGVIFATLFAREQPRNVASAALNTLRALALTAVCCAIIGVMFFLEFGFAIVHTLRSVQGALSVPSLFRELLEGMTGLASGGQHAQVITFAEQFGKYSNGHLLEAIIAAAVILVVSKPSYSLLVFLAAMLWLHFGMDERETLPAFFTILALGLRETLAVIAAAAHRYRLPAPAFKTLALAGVLVFVAVNTPGLGAPPADPDRRYGANLSQGYMHYSPAMVQDIKAHAYVLTAGIDAMPQIGTSWGLTFYDRMAPSNAYLWNEDNVLLFDVAQSATVADNCSSVIRTEGVIVLCRARKDVPLAYLPVVMPPGRRRTIDLRARPWNTAAGFQRGSAGPHGSADYHFAGTGAVNTGLAQEAVTLAVPVQPGNAYVFSAWVDPSNLNAAGDEKFDFIIYDAAGVYANEWWPVGPPGRYALQPWVCPPGIHRVTLGMGMTASALSSAQVLKFSEPALTEIETVSPSATDKGSS